MTQFNVFLAATTFFVCGLSHSSGQAKEQLASIQFLDQTTRQVISPDFFRKMESSIPERTRETSPKQPLAISVKVEYKKFDGLYQSLGKLSNPLNSSSLKRLERQNPSLAREIKKAHTSYYVEQNGTKFYLAGLPNLKLSTEKISKCDLDKPCPAIFDSVIIETKYDQAQKETAPETIVILRGIEFK